MNQILAVQARDTWFHDFLLARPDQVFTGFRDSVIVLGKSLGSTCVVYLVFLSTHFA